MKPGITLYNPQSNPTKKRILPMSVMALGAVLEGRYDYRIIDGNVDHLALDEIQSRVRQGPHVLAVTVMPGPQLLQAYPQCLALKKEFPELTIVWGGYFPSLHAAACLQSPAVDFVIRGHAERAFLEFLDRHGNGGDWRTLAGLAWRDQGGNVTENPLAPIPHPEELPDYPYDRVEMRSYVRNTFLGNRTLPHHSSYGCPFTCNFCAVVRMVDGRWLAQSASKVARIAALYVERWQANAIEFYDNNFFTHEARVAEIAERIVPLGIRWWGEARIDTLLRYSEATWRAMCKSGLKMVFMGAESASAKTLRRMDKGGTLTPDKTLEMAAKAREHGIIPEFSFVVGNPPDPVEDIDATLRFIRRVKKINPLSEIIIYNYTPVPLDGDLYDAAHADGFRFPETLEDWVGSGWMEFSSRKHARVPWLSEKLYRRIRDFERVLNAYYPTSTNLGLSAGRRAVLRAASAWRYHAGIYGFPLELRALHRLFRYQRPETAGF